MTRSLYGATAGAGAQAEWLRTGDVPVAVYGLGKMGLPLAAVYAETTGNVTGVDVDESVVEAVNDGDCPVRREPGLPALVESLVDRHALGATTDSRAAAEQASVHVVIVPTLVDDDHDPDLSAVTDVARDVAAGLSPGDVVFVESTVPPGTCRDVLYPLLDEEADVPTAAFGLAFCPERTSSGRALRDVRGAYPKVVGGVDGESTRVAELVYGELVDNDVIPVADATTAEAVKVFEGLYRDANIALANDLARLTDELGIEVRDAIDAANTQPFCDIHTPGPGVGGHCIPYYPYFVLNWLQTDAPTVATARRVNDGMPGFVADRVAEGLAARDRDVQTAPHSRDGGDEPRAASGRDGDDAAPRCRDGGQRDGVRDRPGAYATDGGAVEDARVGVLGLTYRAGVAETRASPGVDVCEHLAERGASVFAADPLVDADGVPAEHVPLDALADCDLDAAVLATAHEEFDAVDWTVFDPLVVVDGHDALDVSGTDHRVYTVGRGWR